VSFSGRPGAELIRENSLGELEISIWLTEHLGDDAAESAQGWDGDRYRLVETGIDSLRALIWYSVWDSEASANTFADAARQVAQKRGRPFRVERLRLGERPAVRVIDADPGVDPMRLTVPEATLSNVR
jgi:hypothetical protein